MPTNLAFALAFKNNSDESLMLEMAVLAKTEIALVMLTLNILFALYRLVPLDTTYCLRLLATEFMIFVAV